MNVAGRVLLALLIALTSLGAMSPKRAEQSAGDEEIRIGNLMPYTGPLAEFAAIGKAEAAYFDMINERGGINGRKVRFISHDDNSDPTIALDLTRGLVEKEDVLLMFGSFGTPGNLAVRAFLNERKIPQLFVASGNEELSDPEAFPGRWAGNRRSAPRGASTPITSRLSIRTARSWCFGRTTSSVAICTREFRRGSAI